MDKDRSNAPAFSFIELRSAFNIVEEIRLEVRVEGEVKRRGLIGVERGTYGETLPVKTATKRRKFAKRRLTRYEDISLRS